MNVSSVRFNYGSRNEIKFHGTRRRVKYTFNVFFKLSMGLFKILIYTALKIFKGEKYIYIYKTSTKEAVNFQIVRGCSHSQKFV